MSTFREKKDSDQLAEWLRDRMQTVSDNEDYGFFRTATALWAITMLFLGSVGVHYAKQTTKTGVRFADSLLRFFFVYAMLGILMFGIGMIIATIISVTVSQLRKRFGIDPVVAVVIAVGIYAACTYAVYRIADWSIRPILDKYVDDDDEHVPITPTDD